MQSWHTTYLDLRELPREISTFELQSFFTYSRTERELINARRSNAHKLGLASPDSQLASVRAAILQSPTEHGFGTELWTLKRVGAVIERLHGVRFSQAHVWRITFDNENKSTPLWKSRVNPTSISFGFQRQVSGGHFNNLADR